MRVMRWSHTAVRRQFWRLAAPAAAEGLLLMLLTATDLLMVSDVYKRQPYAQYTIKPLSINGCEPFLQLGYVFNPERTLSTQAKWIVEHFSKML